MSAFRDLATRFADASAQVLGVSTDDLDTERRFAESLKLPFPLLADPGGKVAASYGVKFATIALRTTFVIGTDGRIEKIISGKDALDPTGALAACPLHPDPPAGNNSL